MDQLSKDAKAASDLGISYGKYMARKHKPVAAVRPGKKMKNVGHRRCVVCGAPILPSTGRRKYCSTECAREGSLQRIRSY